MTTNLNFEQLLQHALNEDGQAYDYGVLVQGDDGTDRRAFRVDTDGHVQIDILSASGTNSLGKTEDQAHTSGDVGVMALAVRKDTASALAGTDGDYIPLIVDSSGQLHIAPLVAGEAHIGQMGGHTVTVSSSFIRPSTDATPYTAGDVVADSTTSPSAITFSNCSRVNAGSGVILGAILVDSANQTSKGSFELWLFSATGAPTLTNDNAAFGITDNDLSGLVGIIPFNTSYVGNATAGANGNCVFPVNGLNIPFVCPADSRTLYGILVVRSAYTPLASETFTVVLRIAQD